MKRILLMNDDALLQNTVRLFLESQGYACEEVENGADTLEWLESNQVDLVVMDHLTSIVNRREFFEQLMEKTRHHDLPVILLNGNMEELDKKRAPTTDVLTILERPCDFNELLTAVVRALETSLTHQDHCRSSLV